ncbi:MAG: DNA topoisomerase VI subunit B [Candidatus Hadarchaeales archaeon]
MKTIADEIFREFREHSVSEFFRKNAAMLGYTGKIRSLTTIVHEGVTNAIDAAEEMGVLPKVNVFIKKADSDPEHLKVIIEDNASGIPEQHIPSVFGKMLAGTKLHRYMQQRGQQGIGISGSVMFSQMTAGKPARVITSTGNGEVIGADVMIDVNKNEGRIVRLEKKKEKWRGTRVELEVKEVTYVRSRYGPFNYLRLTAIANPHVSITFVEPDGTLTIFENAVKEVPKKPVPMLPHPLGMLPDDLITIARTTKARTISTMLSTELSRVSKLKADQVCKLAGVPPTKKPLEMTWEDAEKILAAFKKVKILAPSAEGLRPIGAAAIMEGMKQILNPEFVHAITRAPKIYRGGIPFIVEVGIAYGGNAGARGKENESEEIGIELLRFANRAPLLFDQGGCVMTAAARSIDWKRYGIDPALAPVTLMINIASAYVPYTSAGKQSVADEPEIYEEVRAAIMEAARELKSYLFRKIRSKEKKERAQVFEKYLPVIANKAAKLAGVKPPDISSLLKRIVGESYAEEG